MRARLATTLAALLRSARHVTPIRVPIRCALLAAFAGLVVAALAVLALPPLTARPVYSVAQVQAGLTPRRNLYGGRTLWVRAVAVIGSDVGTYPNAVELLEHAPIGSSDAFSVWVQPPNVTFALLTWEAAIARRVPWLRWLYGRHSGVYRVRFFKPTWCMSCPVGQLQ